MRIQIEGLTFSYGEKRILEDLRLTVESGERVGLLGVSGGGKSTLLKLISGLYEAKTGTISIENAKTAAERRQLVAMVMQNAPLFPTSIRENITCGHPLWEEWLEAACRAAQLSDWLATLPEGPDTFVGERGGRVSGGQAQRIAIARAIAKDAPVILLDEPTSALDGETTGALLTALENLTRGKTVLHVSHRPETLRDCTRVLRLEGGRLYVE